MPKILDTNYTNYNEFHEFHKFHELIRIELDG